MMDISHLLNPTSGNRYTFAGPGSPVVTGSPVTPLTTALRRRISKDAPIFSEDNKTVGHVNFPPHEAGDDPDLNTQHRRFSVFPSGKIAQKGVRHVPYSSDKKDFSDKTGRDAFECECVHCNSSQL